MNLQQLYYFKTVAELEHYTRAAEMLRVNQSSLSHAMQSLEQELNVRLFSRSGRNVVLSQYGKMFLPHVLQALDTLENGVTELRSAVDPETGIVSIACFASLSEFVPDIIVRYISETNRVDARLQTSQATYYELRDELLNGRIDLLFATEIRDPHIDSTPIGEQGFVLLVPEGHRFAERERVDLHELDGEDYIAYSKECQLRQQYDEIVHREGIRPRIKAETAQDVMIYGLVAAGHGIAVTPRPLGGAPYRVRLVSIDGIPARKLYLMWNKENYISPAAASFRDFVIKGGRVFDEYRLRNNIQ